MKPDNRRSYSVGKWSLDDMMREMEIAEREEKELQKEKHLSDVALVNQNARGK
jgi:hypothetical protein